MKSHVLYTPAQSWAEERFDEIRREVAKEGTPSRQLRLGHLSVNICSAKNHCAALS